MKEKLKKLVGIVKAMWNKPLPGRFLTLKEAGAFGIYALGNSWIYNSLLLVVAVTQIPYFYEIPAVHGYVIYILGTLITAIFTPIIGNAMEKKRTKWGRYKPYILFSLPALALFTMLAMWIPQYDDLNSTIAYAYIACVPSIAIAVFANNMYQTMPNVITPNHQERADIMTPVGLLVGFAPTIMNIIAGPIRSAYIDRGQEYMAMRIIGIISIVLGIICIMFIIKVKERVYELEVAPDIAFADKDDGEKPQPETDAEMASESEETAASVPAAVQVTASVEAGENTEEQPVAAPPQPAAAQSAATVLPAPVKKGNALKDFFALLGNKPLLILFLALIFGSLREFYAQFRLLIIQLRFSSDVTTALDIMGLPNTIIGFASTVAMLLLPIVTRKMNRNHIIIMFTSLGMVVCAILGFVGIENIPIGTTSAVVLTILFFIACINPTYLLVPVMLGEIADYQQAKNGKRYEGYLQNYIFTIPGVFTQIAMLLAWIWQSAIGFEPAQISMDIQELHFVAESTRAIANEWFNAAFLLSAASAALMIITLLFYPLTKKKSAEITAKLQSEAANMDEMGEGNKEEFDATVAAETERLSDGETSVDEESDGGTVAEDGAEDDDRENRAVAPESDGKAETDDENGLR